jgi:hypothetical protein
MTYQHKNLASGRWKKLSFLEQMAHIGSEVERTISWKEKSNEEYSQKAFFRSLELFDLTLDANITPSQRKEVARAREIWVDFIEYDNQYKSTKKQWRNYFLQLLIALKMK